MRRPGRFRLAHACWLLVVLASLPLTAAMADERPVDELIQWTDGMLNDAIAARRASGIAVALVKDGELVFQKGYGHADAAGTLPVDPSSTLFSLASITKSFTATAIAQLAEQGRIASLDDAANRYLRRVQLRKVDGREVSIRNLLDHRGGLDESFFGLATVATVDLPIPAAAIERRLPPQVRAPGEVSVYSNAGYGLLGILIEDLTGETLGQYFQRHILAPLGMTRSFLRYAVDGSDAPIDSTGKVGEPADLFADGRRRPNPQSWAYHPFIAASAGLMSTATDMARFMTAHLAAEAGRAPELLGAELARRMHTRGIANHPAVSGFGMSFIVQEQNGQRIFENAGSGPGYQATMIMLPQQSLGIVVLIMGGVAQESLVDRLRGALSRAPSAAQVPARETLNMFEVRQHFLDHVLGASALGVDETPKVPVAALAGLYRNERRPHTSLEALFSPGVILDVKVGADDTLTINGESGYRQISRGVFWKPGPMPYVPGPASADLYAFTLDNRGVPVYATQHLGMDVFKPVSVAPSWVRNATLILLLFCATGLIAWFWRPGTPSLRWTRRVAIALGLAALAVPAFLIVALLSVGNITVYLALGHTVLFWMLAALTNLVSALAVATAYCCWRGWSAATASGALGASAGMKLHLTLLALSGLALIPAFAYFNLVGFRIP